MQYTISHISPYASCNVLQSVTIETVTNKSIKEIVLKLKMYFRPLLLVLSPLKSLV